MTTSPTSIGVRAGIDPRSLRLTENGLKAAQRFLPLELHKALLQTLRRVEKYAKAKAPVDKGETRNRIHSAYFSATEGAVGTDQEAAMAIDQGARPHQIKPRNVKALTIPLKFFDRKTRTGKFVSRSQRDKKGRAKLKQRAQYTDVANAPNKRHMDVEFTFAGRVHHPGKAPQPFLTAAASIANRVAAEECNKAVDRALARGNAK